MTISFCVLRSKMKTLFGIATLAFSASAIELTPDTWDAQTSGKTVFVKFFAPWCGHCKRMKPDWDKLMSQYADSPSVLVADVDCIGAGKPLCDKVGVQGFPTIKHGNPDALEDYKGARDFDSIEEFAAKLKPPCNPSTLENCDEAQQAEVKRLLALDEDDIIVTIEEAEKRVKENENEFKTKVEGLQRQYEAFKRQYDNTQKALEKETDIGFHKLILKHKQDNKNEL